MIEEVHNLYAHCGTAVLDPRTRQPISVERLREVLPPSLAELELSREPRYRLPEPVRELYATYRPTPLARAERFERAIGTECEIYVKDEGRTPTGNHKANSAILIAYLCRRDGIETVVTETTGNWGLALARACSSFGVRTVCFIDAESDAQRPDRSVLMREAGAEVVVVPPDEAHGDLLTLSADAAIAHTRRMEGAVYIFGSVYNYFLTPQTIIGAEAREQLGDAYPDVVVGSCGGGANLLGTAGAFIVDHLESGRPVEVVCAESEHCPIVSGGVLGQYSIDTAGVYPMLETYGLPGLLSDEYIGGLGSTIVAQPVAELHRRGLISPVTLTAKAATEAARIFQETEGCGVALETGYQLAAAIRVARTNSGRRILLNISSRGSSRFA